MTATAGQPIKVSVIIPVYGVERYIERCARSLFSQTMTDGIEFIFVDDHTPDRSIDIVNTLLPQYPLRIPQTRIVTHAENQGLAVARVTGLNAARGEYVIHCDSDDWVEPDMYQSLLDEAHRTGADITGCDFFEELPDGPRHKRQLFNLPHNQLLLQLATAGEIEGFLWNRLVRRDFYLTGRYHAPKGTTLFEDLAVTLPMHAATEKVAYVPRALYHYNRTIPSSMSSVIDLKTAASATAVLLSLIGAISIPEVKNALYRRLTYYLYYPICNRFHYAPEMWHREYLAIANSLRCPLPLRRRVSRWLVAHRLYRLNLAMLKARHIFN